MKSRKTNRAKQTAHGCRNNGTCKICNGNRTYANRHAEPAPDNDPMVVECDNDPDTGDYNYLCVGCRAPLGNPKYHRFGAVYCSLNCACGEIVLELEATPLVAKLFDAIPDASFRPLTDAERADALARGKKGRP